MADYFIFFRCWPGFSKDFPFDKFNGLPDEELPGALEAHARDWVRSNKPTVRRLIDDRKRKLSERVAKQNRRAACAFPSPGLHKPLDLRRFRDAQRVRASANDPDKAKLIFKPGAPGSFGVRMFRIAGWANVPGDRFGEPYPTKRVFVARRSSREGADEVCKALALHFQAVERRDLMPRFGYLPASSLSAAESAYIELSIADLDAVPAEDDNLERGLGRNIARLAARIEVKLREIQAREKGADLPAQAEASHTELANSLTDRQRDILHAMFELAAFTRHTRRTIEDIAKGAEGRQVSSDNFKQPMSDLSKRGFTDSIRGPGGGCWLTEPGRKLAAFVVSPDDATA